MQVKKFFIAILTVACVCATVLGLVACKTDNSDTQKEDKGMSFVTLDINPSIEIVVDGENKVASVYGANEDGKVLLYNETGIQGEDVEVAIDKIINLAVNMGYLSEDNKAVDVSVSSEKDATGEELTSKVNAKITATAKNLGLNVTTTADGAYSDLQKLKELKAAYPDNALIQSLTVSKFKLVASATEDGKIDVEAAVELDDSELIKIVNDAHKAIADYATDAYKEAVAKADMAYASAVEIAKDSVYLTYYTRKVFTNPTVAFNGSVYYMYALTSKGFNLVANVYDYIEIEREYPLDEERVSQILQAFGMDENEVDKLKDADGNVTIGSVEAYIDKMVKNTSVYGDFTEVQADVESALTEAKASVKAVIDAAKAEYKDQIEYYITTADAALSAVQSLVAAIPGATEMLNSSLATYQEVVAKIKLILEDGAITADELRDCATKLDAKASEYKDKVNNDFTADELKQIEADQAKAVETLSAQKKVFDDAVETAKKNAQSSLEKLKNERLNAQAQA